jgi:hypothetical protein
VAVGRHNVADATGRSLKVGPFSRGASSSCLLFSFLFLLFRLLSLATAYVGTITGVAYCMRLGMASRTEEQRGVFSFLFLLFFRHPLPALAAGATCKLVCTTNSFFEGKERVFARYKAKLYLYRRFQPLVCRKPRHRASGRMGEKRRKEKETAAEPKTKNLHPGSKGRRTALLQH